MGSNLTTVMGSKVNLGWSIQKSTTPLAYFFYIFMKEISCAPLQKKILNNVKRFMA